MKPARDIARRELVLVGGGHSHVEVLRRLAMKPDPTISVTLISREIAAPYSGMLPGYIAGHYSKDDCSIDLHKLCYAARARFYADEVVGLDLTGGNVSSRHRPPVRFDVLSLDIGSTPDRLHIPGADRFALPVKPVDRFMRGWEAVEKSIAGAQSVFRVVIVGGGAGGTELCLALQHRTRDLLRGNGERAQVAFTLVSESNELLPTHNRRVRSIFARIARSRGVALLLGRPVQRVTSDQLHFAEGKPLGFDALVWATNAAAPSWLHSTGLALDQRGFVRVDACLRSISHGNVFAAGDIASIEGMKLAKSGVYAVRQGPILAHNVFAQCAGTTLKRFHPQRSALALISTGDRYAVASKWRLSARGRWVWSVKDWIDRRWMRKYQQLKPMIGRSTKSREPGDTADTQMYCGGCGAKLGSNSLHRMLAGLNVAHQADVVIGLDEPDDAAAISPPSGMVLVQSVDYFRPFMDDPYRFARIATNHCLNDLYAMGAMPHSALAIVTLPQYGDEAAEADLRDLMTGATGALSEAGAALVGGHTGRGVELGFGMTVNGFARPEQLFRKGGLRAGDALILTKPLGTGAVLAGHMRGLARASWIEAALDLMERSNRQAVETLRRQGVVACTDVSGYGLIGHLLEMLRASETDAIVRTGPIVGIPGAIELLAQGVESTLAPHNRALGSAVRNCSEASQAEIDLLFDPQTAGGLLFAIRADCADECVDALVSADFVTACRIGMVTKRASSREAIVLES